MALGQRITIEIVDKIATCLTELPVVCGNSDYEVEFKFDEEWNEHSVKTARFRVNGEYTDVVFEGDICNMPIITNAKIVWIGVFAGELSTSTPAIVYCKPSILDGEDVPAPPRDDVYSQIVALCNEAVETAKSVEERADNGDFKGDKGDTGDKGEAGVIDFIVVSELPTENIKNTIYLVPTTNEDGSNAFDEFLYIDGEWEKIGSAGVEINLDDYVKPDRKPATGNHVYMRINGTDTMKGCIGALTANRGDIDGFFAPFKVINGIGQLTTGTPTTDFSCANKKYVDDSVGDISSALDELHIYAQALIGGNV